MSTGFMPTQVSWPLTVRFMSVNGALAAEKHFVFAFGRDIHVYIYIYAAFNYSGTTNFTLWSFTSFPSLRRTTQKTLSPKPKKPILMSQWEESISTRMSFAQLLRAWSLDVILAGSSKRVKV